MTYFPIRSAVVGIFHKCGVCIWPLHVFHNAAFVLGQRQTFVHMMTVLLSDLFTLLSHFRSPSLLLSVHFDVDLCSGLPISTWLT